MTCQNSYLQRISKNGSYNRYYIERFMGMRCAPDLLLHRMYPNAKEVTESFGCYEAAINNLSYSPSDKVNVVCVGDGHTPRTAAMFAFRSSWNTYSIDPELRERTSWNRINRLTRITKRIQDAPLSFSEPTVIVHCHAHVKVEDSLKQIKAPNRSVITMECCVPQYLNGVKPDIEYVDNCVWTPCNRIKIWKNV